MAINYHLLGKKIQRLRIERNISQIRFAEIIETSSTFVSCLERGVKGPSLETMIKIADALDTSMDILLAESRRAAHIGQMSEIGFLLKDCSIFERYVILQTIKEIKYILREAEKLQSSGTHINR